MCDKIMKNIIFFHLLVIDVGHSKVNVANIALVNENDIHYYTCSTYVTAYYFVTHKALAKSCRAAPNTLA